MQARDAAPAWPRLRAQVENQASLLSAPDPEAAGLCALCRRPVHPGQARCYRCDRYGECLAGLLPDVVVPVAYAAKGGPHATNLWLYKSPRPGAAAARSALRALLLVFLRDHGGCLWRRAGSAGPTHVAVVPSRRGRPGAHPLEQLVAPYLTLGWARLVLDNPDQPPADDPDPSRFRAERRLAGASVLLLDDTWTTGASAISAAAAIRLAGARSVAVVVLGRHLDAAPAAAAGDPGRSPLAMPFRPWLCAVHPPGATQ